jgi:uncharacterized membrane protein
MTWRGSTTVPDRIFACLPYLLPLIDGLMFGFSLLTQFPALQVILIPLQPIRLVYGSLGPFGQIIVFFALFLLVVRNEKINHFIRYNTMQAILLDIIVFLSGIALRIIALPGIDFAVQTVASIIFVGLVAAIGYSVGKSLMGRYAEIPTLSNAVYMQVR